MDVTWSIKVMLVGKLSETSPEDWKAIEAIVNEEMGIYTLKGMESSIRDILIAKANKKAKILIHKKK